MSPSLGGFFPTEPLGRASLVAQLVKICLQCGRPGFDPWVSHQGSPLDFEIVLFPIRIRSQSVLYICVMSMYDKTHYNIVK